MNREEFLRNVSGHYLFVNQLNGLNRDLIFKSLNNDLFAFNVHTWEGKLCIDSDMGTTVFKRHGTDDMFNFFRSEDLRINPDYWIQKVIARQEGKRSYHTKRRGYSHSFIWQLYAIVWGIKKFEEYEDNCRTMGCAPIGKIMVSLNHES